MYALAINGSPRKEGNTSILLNTVLETLADTGWETEEFSVAGKKVSPCLGCCNCMKTRDMHCVIKNDVLHNGLFDKMIRADAILIGSPTYFANLTPQTKSVMDRAGFVALANGMPFAGKIGAAVVAVRRGGAIHVFDSINHFFLICQMIVPGSTYWNMGLGMNSGEVQNDEEGLANMRHLGRVIGWLGSSLAHNMKNFPKEILELDEIV